MRHLKKFNSGRFFDESDFKEIKSYFQDIQDEMGISVRVQPDVTWQTELNTSLFGKSSVDTIDVIIFVDVFIREKMKLGRNPQTGLILSMVNNFDEELIDLYEILSNFYKLLSISLKQVSNNPDYTIINNHAEYFIGDITHGKPIIIRIQLRR